VGGGAAVERLQRGELGPVLVEQDGEPVQHVTAAFRRPSAPRLGLPGGQIDGLVDLGLAREGYFRLDLAGVRVEVPVHPAGAGVEHFVAVAELHAGHRASVRRVPHLRLTLTFLMRYSQ
jgi:hypothetical protein